jgi:predicted aminopeptidase
MAQGKYILSAMKRSSGILAPLLTGVHVLLLGSCYVTTQGYHLMRHQLSARSIERVSSSVSIQAEQQLFREVERLRAFGLEEIGLVAGKSFTTYVRTDRDYLVDVVSAARADRFERKEWRFPFFGSFPYKGFYRPEPAVRLTEQLRREGWDVYVRRVDAFSTLGFFRDPLYTFMLEYEESRLADLILHEMAHATLWVRSEAQFNEEFATFVGRTGAREYLLTRYTPEDPWLLDLEERRRDGDTYREDMLRLRDELHQLYEGAIRTDAARAPVLQEKERIIAEFQKEFAATYHERYQSERYLAGAEIAINNAYLDLFSTYTGNLHLFEELHLLLGGSLRETVDVVISLVNGRAARESPTDALRRMLEELREDREAVSRGTISGKQHGAPAAPASES